MTRPTMIDRRTFIEAAVAGAGRVAAPAHHKLRGESPTGSPHLPARSGATPSDRRTSHPRARLLLRGTNRECRGLQQSSGRLIIA